MPRLSNRRDTRAAPLREERRHVFDPIRQPSQQAAIDDLDPAVRAGDLDLVRLGPQFLLAENCRGDRIPELTEGRRVRLAHDRVGAAVRTMGAGSAVQGPTGNLDPEDTLLRAEDALETDQGSARRSKRAPQSVAVEHHPRRPHPGA